MIKELITYYNCWKYKVPKTTWIRPRVTIRNRDKVNFGHHVEIGEGSYLEGSGGIKIGNYVLIAPNVGIFSADHTDVRNDKMIKKKIKIGDNVWIGFGSAILKGVTIGNGVTIGANSTITKDIPDNCVVVGVNKLIRKK